MICKRRAPVSHTERYFPQPKETHNFSPGIRDIARVHTEAPGLAHTAPAHEPPIEAIELRRPRRRRVQPDEAHERLGDRARAQVVRERERVERRQARRERGERVRVDGAPAQREAAHARETRERERGGRRALHVGVWE